MPDSRRMSSPLSETMGFSEKVWKAIRVFLTCSGRKPLIVIDAPLGFCVRRVILATAALVAFLIFGW